MFCYYNKNAISVPVRAWFRVLSCSRNASTSVEASTENDNGGHCEENKHPIRKSIEIPFSRARVGAFFQSLPQLGNQFKEDVTLRRYLKRVLPSKIYNTIKADLNSFGVRVATDIYDLHLDCEQNPPRLQTYNAWGRRVDNLLTCSSWKQLKRESAQEGLVAIGYEREFGQWSRLYQAAKLYLFSPSSGLYSCPLAMTDGAAKILEVLDDLDLKKRAFSRLTSRDPDQFWTSGQWMTERRGGSDVANGTETVAVPQSDGTYKLYGYKWFSSATDSDMTITLARVPDKHGNLIPGTKGLSMFYVEVRDELGALNNIEVQRLKDKLGTRQLPTAELLLDGTKAIKISDEGRGVASISHMLTLTRLHNTMSSAAVMKRVFHFARDYSHKRQAFGRLVKDHPLHIKTLANMEVENRAALLLLLEMALLLGKEETGQASPGERDLLRILTPIAKLYTGKQAMSVVSEGLECFGGMGYLEDTGLPLLLRDSQVLTIWEGTTNILSLDVLRALAKSQGQALAVFHQSVTEKLQASCGDSKLGACCEKLTFAITSIIQFGSQHPDKLELAARDFAFSLARIYMGTLLVEHAGAAGSTPADCLAAIRWCDQDLQPAFTKHTSGHYDSAIPQAEYQLAMEGYEQAA